MLLVFLLDERTRPSPKGMKLWTDLVNWLKSGSFGFACGPDPALPLQEASR